MHVMSLFMCTTNKTVRKTLCGYTYKLYGLP